MAPKAHDDTLSGDEPRVDRDTVSEADTARLQREILGGIPLAASLGLRVDRVAADGIQLTAPWDPNRNGHGSLFGGSAVALGLVAGWALVREGLRELGIAADVVIHDLNVRFDQPILDEVRVRALRPARRPWERFCRTVEKRGKGRISVRIELDSGDPPGGSRGGRPPTPPGGSPPKQTPTVLSGRFVALRRR